MEIRKLTPEDIETVVDLWYKTSVIAHDFIPSNYWKKNMMGMATQYLPNSETYVAVYDEKIAGFVSMVEDFLAAIFVDNEIQGKGTGKKLLDFVKVTRTTIQLKVYKKNIRTVDFYKSQGFEIMSESKEEETGEYEFLMVWKR